MAGVLEADVDGRARTAVVRSVKIDPGTIDTTSQLRRSGKKRQRQQDLQRVAELLGGQQRARA